MFRCGWGGALAATPQAWGRMGFTGFTRFTTTELHSSISAARAAPRWTQWQRKRHHCLLEPLNERARETRWSKISKMIRCEKAKKRSEKAKGSEFFVQQKMFFARDVRFERIVIVSRWAIAKTFRSAWGRTFGYNEFGIFGPLVMSFGESIILSLADVETRPKSRQCRRLDANISWILDD